MAKSRIAALVAMYLISIASPAMGQELRFIVDPRNVTEFIGATNVRLQAVLSSPGIFPLWEVFRRGWWYYIYSNDTQPCPGQYWIDHVNGDLYIPVLKEWHAGTYRGSHTIDNNNIIVSNNVYVSVLRSPFLQLCNTQLVCMNSFRTSGSLCVSTDGNPGVKWTVFKLVGQMLMATNIQASLPPYIPPEIINCADSTRQTQANISLSSSTPFTAGQYVLVASDLYGNRNVTFGIGIAGVPQIDIPNSIVIQNYSKSFTISCAVPYESVECSGSVSIFWLNEGPEGPIVSQDTSSPVYTVNTNFSSILTFQSLQKDQTGKYVCVVTRSRDNSMSTVTVYGPPDPVSDLSSSVSQEGVVTLTWTPPNSGPFKISYTVYYSKADSESMTVVALTSPNVQLSGLQEGHYVAYVVTVGQNSSTIVQSNPSGAVQFSVEPRVYSNASPVVGAASGSAASVLLLIILVPMVVLGLVWFVRQKRNSQAQSWDLETEPPSDARTVPTLVIVSAVNMSSFGNSRLSNSYEVDPKWEFPPDLLQLSEVLYEGFSTVLHKGTANGIKSDKAIDVAVKSCKDHASEEDLRALIADMEQLAGLGSHPNIISLLRVCTVESPLYMVVEYMCHGDLLGFLRASRGHHGMYTVFPGNRELLPSLNLTSRDLINIATKIASGMTFLTQRKVIHGSLCARNVLVGTSLDIKINVGAYDLNKDSLLKWMSPETLFDGTSTTYSDVWSFGVTMWELVTLGGTPYAEILPLDLYSQLLGGMRMPKPMHCAQEVYDIIRLCWEKLPIDRLSFATLHERLDTLSHSKVSFLDLQLYSDETYSQFEDSNLSFPTSATVL